MNTTVWSQLAQILVNRYRRQSIEMRQTGTSSIPAIQCCPCSAWQQCPGNSHTALPVKCSISILQMNKHSWEIINRNHYRFHCITVCCPCCMYKPKFGWAHQHHWLHFNWLVSSWGRWEREEGMQNAIIWQVHSVMPRNKIEELDLKGRFSDAEPFFELTVSK